VRPTTDGFAFDANRAELWTATLPASAHSTPMTCMGKDGVQYVVVAASGGTSIGGGLPISDALVVRWGRRRADDVCPHFGGDEPVRRSWPPWSPPGRPATECGICASSDEQRRRRSMGTLRWAIETSNATPDRERSR
jgi:hypothetical protein